MRIPNCSSKELAHKYFDAMLKRKRPFEFEEHVEQWLEHRRWEELRLLAHIKESTESPIEAIAYLTLITNLPEARIWPQKKIGKYRVDFFVEYAGYQIVVECDGHEFHERTKEQASRDKERDRYFTKAGYVVLRYTGTDIKRDPYQIISDITIITEPTLREMFKEV